MTASNSSEQQRSSHPYAAKKRQLEASNRLLSELLDAFSIQDCWVELTFPKGLTKTWRWKRLVNALSS